MNFLNLITGPIIDGVMAGLKEMRALKQFEDMQGEILEGWVFKIKVAVERSLREADIRHDVYVKVMESIDKIVKEEFDTRKL